MKKVILLFAAFATLAGSTAFAEGFCYVTKERTKSGMAYQSKLGISLLKTFPISRYPSESAAYAAARDFSWNQVFEGHCSWLGFQR